jgi:hypothetical protein
VLVPTFTERGNAIVPLGIAALGLVLYAVFHPGVRTRGATVADAPLDLGDGVVDLTARRREQEEQHQTGP